MAWLRTAELCREIGCSRSALIDLRAAGIFKPGEHYRRLGTGTTSPLQWHLEAVEAAMADHTRRMEAGEVGHG